MYRLIPSYVGGISTPSTSVGGRSPARECVSEEEGKVMRGMGWNQYISKNTALELSSGPCGSGGNSYVSSCGRGWGEMRWRRDRTALTYTIRLSFTSSDLSRGRRPQSSFSPSSEPPSSPKCHASKKRQMNHTATTSGKDIGRLEGFFFEVSSHRKGSTSGKNGDMRDAHHCCGSKKKQAPRAVGWDGRAGERRTRRKKRA
ncbi:hypothetical protein FB451DRAFT_1176212 [Mycena latifolia]|nr:hypothetical protein FB451DRAFT_1176212 [Mycena latifolia]